MAVRIVESTDPIEVKHICVLFYGQPGSRKSSLAQTGDEPFTIATDPGIYRAYGRKTCALVETWGDVLECSKVPEFGRSRLVVTDTLGMLLEKLSLAIAADNVKNGNRMGGLSLQGYGVLKAQFAQWVASIKASGKDLCFLCHEKAEKNGDESYWCPDIVGGSYNTMMNHADVVGYMHFDQGRRVIDFSPTDKWMAKTPPCGWSQIALPDFSQDPDFLTKLIAQAKASMGQVSASSAAMAKIVDEWRDRLDADPTLEQLNAMLPEMGALTNGTKRQVWTLISQHAERCGLWFDKASKVFVVKQEAA